MTISLETTIADRFRLKTAPEKWYLKIQDLLDQAPDELIGRVRAYTTGDKSITLYDSEKYDRFVAKRGSRFESTHDVCEIVELSGSKLGEFKFPFDVESTCG